MRRNSRDVPPPRGRPHHQYPQTEYDPRLRHKDSRLVESSSPSSSGGAPLVVSRPDSDSNDDYRRRRSRSRSPPSSPREKGEKYPQQLKSSSSSKDELAAARRARMARLRAENDEEERRLAFLEKHSLSSTHPDASTFGAQKPAMSSAELEGLDEEEQMRHLLGFGGFGSTKNTKVDDNHKTLARGAAAKNKARKYRQYMNRKNGFNRPLDKMD